tara:strand:- start:231 stop:341 length:111 start_codon:yes stop_codon:yes gene_type:complete
MTFIFGALAGVVLTALVLAFDPNDDLYEDERRDCLT